jgi:hypothetical protein
VQGRKRFVKSLVNEEVGVLTNSGIVDLVKDGRTPLSKEQTFSVVLMVTFNVQSYGTPRFETTNVSSGFETHHPDFFSTAPLLPRYVVSIGSISPPSPHFERPFFRLVEDTTKFHGPENFTHISVCLLEPSTLGYSHSCRNRVRCPQISPQPNTHF